MSTLYTIKVYNVYSVRLNEGMVIVPMNHRTITLHPGRRFLSAKDEMQAQGMPHSHDSELTNVAILVRDGTTLSAWSIQRLNGNGKAVILLHGLSDNRLGMIGYAELLLRHGFSVLVPDARAHGNGTTETANGDDRQGW